MPRSKQTSNVVIIVVVIIIILIIISLTQIYVAIEN
jgi:hypothetical protein